MNNKTTRLLSALVISILLSPLAGAEEKYPSLGVGGLLFGDLYHIASHHTEEGDGAAGAVIRRGYLTFNAGFAKNWFGRMRFELNQSGEFETYDFEVDFKDLYVGWRSQSSHQLLIGLSPTPTFDLIESIWSFRYLARTPMDRQGVASRDTGISAQGPLNSRGTISYRTMIGTGREFGNESGDGRKFMGALNWKPASGWDIDLYADYEKLSGPTDRTTLQGFLARQWDDFRFGVMYSYQDREEDPPLELASAFLIKKTGEKTRWVGRVDRLFEPSPSGDNISYIPFDPSAKATFFITGVEFQPSPHFYVTPNIIYTHYDRNDQGVRPESDLHLRLTMFINFE